MTKDNDHLDHSDRHLDRRAAIKRGVVGATAAGVVWSAPRIQGLSLRPNYAAAQSTPGVTAVWNTFDGPGTLTPSTGACWGTPSELKAQSQDFNIIIPRINTNGRLTVAVIATPGYDQVTLTADKDDKYSISGHTDGTVAVPVTLNFNVTCT